MRNKEQITCLDIAQMIDGKFIREIEARKCVILYHYISGLSFIGRKENIFTSMIKKILINIKEDCKSTKEILKPVNCYLINRYIGLCQAFNILCVHGHFLIISQNSVKCKYNLKKN